MLVVTLALTLAAQPAPASAAAPPVAKPVAPPVAAPAVASERLTVVVVDDRAIKDQAPAAFIDKALAEIARRKGLKAVRMSEQRKQLDARGEKALTKCGDDAGCLATAAREMGADLVLMVRLSKREGEDARFLAVTRINALRPQMSDDAGTIVGSEKEALPHLAEQIAELFPEIELAP